MTSSVTKSLVMTLGIITSLILAIRNLYFSWIEKKLTLSANKKLVLSSKLILKKYLVVSIPILMTPLYTISISIISSNLLTFSLFDKTIL